MARTERDYFPRRINMYVPAAQYASDVSSFGPHSVNFGAPAVADTDNILDGTSIATAGSTTTLLDDESDAPFGRTVSVVASGAATSTVTIIGRDYLGQPMKQTLTLNGTTGVDGTKAFYWLDEIEYGATASVTIDVGWGPGLGLPYKTVKVLSEEDDGAVVATLGTLTGPVLTDPATATTGDPRGTYDPQTTLDGAAVVTITVLVDSSVNSSDNGGLYGIEHYFA